MILHYFQGNYGQGKEHHAPAFILFFLYMLPYDKFLNLKMLPAPSCTNWVKAQVFFLPWRIIFLIWVLQCWFSWWKCRCEESSKTNTSSCWVYISKLSLKLYFVIFYIHSLNHIHEYAYIHSYLTMYLHELYYEK